MYGGFGLPAMGIRGIALATLVAQSGGVVFLGRRAWKTGLLSRSTGAEWRPHLPTLRAIAGQGIPASLNMMSVALGIFIITWFLSRFGQTAVAAYGVATRIEQIVLLPTIGLNVAALTLAAQNGGAGLYGRVRETARKSLLYGGVVMVAGSVFIYFGAGPLMRLFTDDPAVIAQGTTYLRVIAPFEAAMAFELVLQGAFGGAGNSLPPLVLCVPLSAARIPLALLLSRRLGASGIWWAIALTTLVKGLLMAAWFKLGRWKRTVV